MAARHPRTRSGKSRRAKSHPAAAGKARGSKGRVNKWSAKVTTVSTFPPKDLFTRDATTIARVMATSKVSPKGLGSAVRMVQFYINRAGKNLSSRQRGELEKAKQLLQEKNRRARAKQRTSS